MTHRAENGKFDVTFEATHDLIDTARSIVERYQGESYLYIDSTRSIPVGTELVMEMGTERTFWFHRGNGYWTQPTFELNSQP